MSLDLRVSSSLIYIDGWFQQIRQFSHILKRDRSFIIGDLLT
ncbi:hypothetical protein [Brunnivagina elsteri]|nr:hypothetical protein [Calothrix elsteri]